MNPTDYINGEINFLKKAKPFYRKSFGEFKALLIWEIGLNKKTEIVEKLFNPYTRKYERGITYKTKEEAISAAKLVIINRIEEAEKRLNKYSNKEN